MQRYFVQFNYFGTRFRGLQKQLYRHKIEKLSEPEVKAMYEKDEITVQGALESAVWNIVKPPNPVKFVTSCRTDKGVHALVNTAHVDLCPSVLTGKYVPPREITKQLNIWMINKNFDIRVRKTVAVPPEFHSRHDVSSRSYLYKIAVVPENLKSEKEMFNTWSKPPFQKRYRRSKAKEFNNCLLSKLSLLESGRYFEIGSKADSLFDVELFKQTLSLMEGEHNFSNFCKMAGHYKYLTVEGKRYTEIPKTPEEMTKTVNKIEVISQPPPLPASVYPIYEGEGGIHFLDVVIHGQSFLHNQVRRMIGAAVSVANGKIPLEKVIQLLDNPESGWESGVFIAPPEGLYLAKVEYKDGVLDNAVESYEEMLKLGKIQLWPTEDPLVIDQSTSDSDILVANDDQICEKSIC